jgi:hypothetical protein
MVAFAVQQATVPGSAPTNFDVTKSGLGTPNGVLNWMTDTSANNSPTAHMRFGIGGMDGTRQFAVATFSKDAESSTLTSRCAQDANDHGFYLQDTNLGSRDGEGEWNAWITDGARLRITNTFSAQYLLNCLLINATNCYVGNAQVTTGNSPLTVTVGFQPDIVLFFGVGVPFDDGHSNPHEDHSFSMGVSDRQGTIVNLVHSWEENDNQGTSEPTAYCSNDKCLAYLSLGAFHRGAKVTSYTSTGFVMTHVSGTGSTAVDFAYVAIEVGSLQHWAGFIDVTSGTGSKAFTDPSFKPQVLGLLPSYLTSADNNTVQSDSDAGGPWGMGVATDADEASSGVMIEDAQDTTDTAAISDAKLINAPEHDGTDGYVGTLSSFDVSGFTINLTTNASGATKQWLAWAVEEEAVGGQPAWKRFGGVRFMGRGHGPNGPNVFRGVRDDRSRWRRASAAHLWRPLSRVFPHPRQRRGPGHERCGTRFGALHRWRHSRRLLQ